ncbi:MAG: energy transducer TonB [Pseudohongiellaceae bacterium]
MFQPQYPYAAARRGLKGFVIVEFDVSEVGAVINPEILVSVPEGAFDRAALRALGVHLSAGVISQKLSTAGRCPCAVCRPALPSASNINRKDLPMSLSH